METTVRKRTKKASTAPAGGTTKAVEIAVDFPREGELIWTGHYAIRLSGTPGAEVEVSINNGDWKPCRPAVGFYWYDWWVDGNSTNEVAARARVGNGKWQKSKTVSCKSSATLAN